MPLSYESVYGPLYLIVWVLRTPLAVESNDVILVSIRMLPITIKMANTDVSYAVCMYVFYDCLFYVTGHT